jgi:signal transduction histidine kinase
LANGLIQQDRLRENSLRPQLKSMDLCDLVQSVASHYPKTAAIEWICPNTPLPMSADPILLSIALYNLVDNALRHHPEQATTAVRVLLSLRRGDQGLPGEWAVVRVSDAGPGVADEDKARMFERFESGQTRSDRAPSGLGLSIVARVAQVHGGRVAVSYLPSPTWPLRIRLDVGAQRGTAFDPLGEIDLGMVTGALGATLTAGGERVALELGPRVEAGWSWVSGRPTVAGVRGGQGDAAVFFLSVLATLRVRVSPRWWTTLDAAAGTPLRPVVIESGAARAAGFSGPMLTLGLGVAVAL